MTMTPPEPGGPGGPGGPPTKAVKGYPGWLLLPDGTYVDASEVIAVQPTGDGTSVTVYTMAASFLLMETSIDDVMALVTRHRKGGPPAVPPGQAKGGGKG